MLQNKLNVFGVRFAVSQLNQHPAAVVAEATEKNLSNLPLPSANILPHVLRSKC